MPTLASHSEDCLDRQVLDVSPITNGWSWLGELSHRHSPRVPNAKLGDHRPASVATKRERTFDGTPGARGAGLHDHGVVQRKSSHFRIEWAVEGTVSSDSDEEVERLGLEITVEAL